MPFKQLECQNNYKQIKNLKSKEKKNTSMQAIDVNLDNKNKTKAPKMKKEKKEKREKKEKTDEEKAQDLGRIIKRFCRKVGANPCDFNPEDFAKAFGKEDDLAKVFGDPQEWQKNFNRGKVWNQKRAVIVNMPEGVIEVIPGQCFVAELEVLNDTKAAWKPNCSITLSEDQTESVVPIQIFNVQIDNEVKGKHQEKVKIPLTVPDYMPAGDKVYEIFLTFRGPKGNPFGQRIPLKIKVGVQTAQ